MARPRLLRRSNGQLRAESAADAFERGYTPWVVRDASASRAGHEVHEAGILFTQRFIGRDQIVDSAVLLAKLEVVTASGGGRREGTPVKERR